MELGEIKELLRQREVELVASGFIEVRQDIGSDSSNPLKAFYYNVKRTIDLREDKKYGELYKSYKELVEAISWDASIKNLKKIQEGQEGALRRSRIEGRRYSSSL